MGSDVFLLLCVDMPKKVSIHAPTWGATIGGHLRSLLHIVSIHAPTWGATKLDEYMLRSYYVSIHAPTWGATQRTAEMMYRIEFQSTLPRGERLDLQRFVNHDERVSIHAPTWGATTKAMLHSVELFVSIHAPTWGATWRCWTIPISSTCFNPRSHVGSDFAISLIPRPPFVSIHAPTWGATYPRELYLSNYYVSIHAPTWGATVQILTVVQFVIVSIHAPTWGATSRGQIRVLYGMFQSTLPRGERLLV